MRSILLLVMLPLYAKGMNPEEKKENISLFTRLAGKILPRKVNFFSFQDSVPLEVWRMIQSHQGNIQIINNTLCGVYAQAEPALKWKIELKENKYIKQKLVPLILYENKKFKWWVAQIKTEYKKSFEFSCCPINHGSSYGVWIKEHYAKAKEHKKIYFFSSDNVDIKIAATRIKNTKEAKIYTATKRIQSIAVARDGSRCMEIYKQINKNEPEKIISKLFLYDREIGPCGATRELKVPGILFTQCVFLTPSIILACSQEGKLYKIIISIFKNATEWLIKHQKIVSRYQDKEYQVQQIAVDFYGPRHCAFILADPENKRRFIAFSDITTRKVVGLPIVLKVSMKKIMLSHGTLFIKKGKHLYPYTIGYVPLHSVFKTPTNEKSIKEKRKTIR